MFDVTDFVHRDGFDVERFDGAAQQNMRRRREMTALFEAIWGELYQGQPDHCFEEIASSFFRSDQIIYLVRRHGEYAGFFIWQHCAFAGYRVIHLRIAGIIPKYQKHRLCSLIRELDFEFDWTVEPHLPRILFLRTRNPILWFEMAKRCSRIGLDLVSGHHDEELVDLGALLAKEFYPEYAYDREAMTSFRVYLSHGKHVFYKEAPHHRDVALDGLFYRHPAMANALDSPCFIGLLVPPSHVQSRAGGRAVVSSKESP